MNGFSYRMITDKDFEEVLTKWWGDWEFPKPPKECLPPSGIVVSDADGDLYAGYLYMTDGAIGWMEWVVSNKDAGVERKRGALDYLVGVFSEMAKEKGMMLMFTSTVLPGFRNGLQKCGFKTGDQGIYQLLKMI